MALKYLTDAPAIRWWFGTDVTAYSFDTVKNRYYFTKGPPFWQPVNARQSGDFLAADYSINQVVSGFRLDCGIAFDICDDGVRPASIENPPRTGLTWPNLNAVLAAIKAGYSVEFYPHGSQMEAGPTPDSRFLALIDGEIGGNRNDGQQVTHLHILWKGVNCVATMPSGF